MRTETDRRGALPLHIVLVEPEIPQNTGNISRTCAATGACLHLVGPMGFSLDDRQLKRAGLDYWHLLDVRHYADLADFFARTAGQGTYVYFSTKAAQVHRGRTYPPGVFLVFGRETAGLPESLLTTHTDDCVRLPMRDSDDARSLNLSNAVAVGVFEVLRQWGYPGMRTRGRLSEGGEVRL